MKAGTSLRHARRQAGLSQRELASRAGVPQSTVGRIENGAAEPRSSTLDRLLRACGFQLEALPKLGEGIDRSLIGEFLRLSPRERIEYNAEAAINSERLVGRALKCDPIQILQALVGYEVQIVLIGGQAAVVHGSPSVTTDLDICYEPSAANYKQMVAILEELGARAAPVKDGHRLTFETNFGNIDCVESPRGIWHYEKLIATACRVDLGGFVVKVAPLEDLIYLKRMAGRPKDLIEVEVLGALRDELEAADE